MMAMNSISRNLNTHSIGAISIPKWSFVSKKKVENCRHSGDN